MFEKNDNSNSKKSKKKNGNLFGAACLLLGLLIILIAFLVKKDQIKKNLQETAFFDRIFGSTPTFIENEKSKNTAKVEESENKIIFDVKDTDDEGDGSVSQSKENQQEEGQKITLGQIKENIEQKKENDTAVNNEGAAAQEKEKSQTVQLKSETEKKENQQNKNEAAKNTESKSVQQNQTEKKSVQAPSKVSGTTDLQLYFTVIDADGSVSRKLVKRTVPKNDSPLTTAINLLLAGPDLSKSAESGLTTFIPKGTKLLGARVSNGIAYLNFSDDLEYNGEGSVGMINSLMQIVYTATSFSTVNSVQFLIEGEKKNYLGEEGIEIGSPLSKINF